MATTAQSQYRREERRVAGQPAQTTNWDDHLDGLLTELNDALPGVQVSTPRTRRGAASSSSVVSRDLAGSHDIPGSEDFHERREFTSPDKRTHTVEERSRHTQRSDGGNQVVSRQVIKSRSSSRITEPSTSPEPFLGLSADDMNGVGLDGVLDRTDTFSRTADSNAAPARLDLSGPLSTVDMPVPGTQSHVTRYEYRSSQRSVSPAAPRRQPPPTLPKPRLPAGFDVNTASATATTERPAPPGAATTINYHIYNYGADGAPPTDSGVGTLERGAPVGGRHWHENSVERQVMREAAGGGQLGRPPSPYPAGERLQSRSVTSQVERTATPGHSGAGTFPVHGETVVTRVERSGAAGYPDTVPFPVETVRDAGLSNVHVPSGPQDGTYPDGPKRRGLGQVIEVRSAQEVTEPPETASDGGQTALTARSQSQSQSQCAAPGVYYPPEQVDCETKFHSKESGKDGNTRTHFEASGKYKAKGGSKQKEAKGGKTIPVCLPCCAGAACTIM